MVMDVALFKMRSRPSSVGSGEVSFHSYVDPILKALPPIGKAKALRCKEVFSIGLFQFTVNNCPLVGFTGTFKNQGVSLLLYPSAKTTASYVIPLYSNVFGLKLSAVTVSDNSS